MADCSVGESLSSKKKWPLLHIPGIESLIIRIIPIRNEIEPEKSLYASESSKPALKEWELNVNSCLRNGSCWRYTHKSFKDIKREGFIPDEEHSCRWAVETIIGFRITITQVICFEITNGWHKYNPITRSKLIRIFFKMAHTLEIS